MTDRSIRISQEPRGPEVHSVRNELLAVACERFRHFGYEKTTVNDLAEAIGFSKAYVYKFFASKQAIGDAIAAHNFSDIMGSVATSVNAASSASGKFRTFVATLDAQCRELGKTSPNLYDVVGLAEASGWPSWRRYASTAETSVCSIIVMGRSEGTFERKTALDEVCGGILTALQPVINPSMRRHVTADMATDVRHLTNLILRSLAP